MYEVKSKYFDYVVNVQKWIQHVSTYRGPVDTPPAPPPAQLTTQHNSSRDNPPTAAAFPHRRQRLRRIHT